MDRDTTNANELFSMAHLLSDLVDDSAGGQVAARMLEGIKTELKKPVTLPVILP